MPLVLHMYMQHDCVSFFYSALFILIGFTNREKLFCSSEDLFGSFENETTFCTITGIIRACSYDHNTITTTQKIG